MKKIKTIWNNSNVLLKSVFVITGLITLSCLFLFILLVTLWYMSLKYFEYEEFDDKSFKGSWVNMSRDF